MGSKASGGPLQNDANIKTDKLGIGNEDVSLLPRDRVREMTIVQNDTASGTLDVQN